MRFLPKYLVVSNLLFTFALYFSWELDYFRLLSLWNGSNFCVMCVCESWGIGYISRCVMLQNVEWCRLRAFLAPWNAFYGVSLISYHIRKENGLERIKTAFIVFVSQNIQISMIESSYFDIFVDIKHVSMVLFCYFCTH